MYEASQLITSVKGEVLRTALPAADTVGGFLPPTPPLLKQIVLTITLPIWPESLAMSKDLSCPWDSGAVLLHSLLKTALAREAKALPGIHSFTIS